MEETNIDNHPKPNEDWISFFRRKRQFADLILMAWSIMEFYVDQLVDEQLGLFYEDKEAKALLDNMSFAKKLNFLKDNAIIKNASEQLGLDINPKLLRKVFADRCERAGIDKKYTDAFCGRTPKSVLERHYTDYSPKP